MGKKKKIQFLRRRGGDVGVGEEKTGEKPAGEKKKG